jgi:hypothetical protein
LFSVEIHTNEDVEFSVDNRLYKKNANYDECIYIIEPTQEAKNIFLDFAKKYLEETLHRKLETVLDRILISRKENITSEEIITITEEIREDKSIGQKILNENVISLSKIYNDMTYQAVINKQQF